MTAIYENYESPWMDDELSILRDAANRFFSTEFVPHKDRWIEQGKVDRDAWNKAGEAGLSVSYTHLTLPTIYSV